MMKFTFKLSKDTNNQPFVNWLKNWGSTANALK